MTAPAIPASCAHRPTVVNGCQLTDPPLKVVLVSEPGVGRVWRRLSTEEIARIEPLPDHPTPEET